jgi:hypothetical protein
MLEKFKTLLELLSKTLKLDGLVLDDSGQVFLLFDNVLLIRMVYEADRSMIHFSSKIAELEDLEDPQLRVDLIQEMLEANLFWAGTQGATLSVDGITEYAMLRAEEPLNALEYERFEKMIENFVNAVEFWGQHVESMKNGTSVPKLSQQQDATGKLPAMMPV